MFEDKIQLWEMGTEEKWGEKNVGRGYSRRSKTEENRGRCVIRCSEKWGEILRGFNAGKTVKGGVWGSEKEHWCEVKGKREGRSKHWNEAEFDIACLI